MDKINYKTKEESLQINGTGLFSKDEVIVSINKEKKGSGIVFVLNNQKIPANVQYVSNTARNTVLTNETKSICLVEHFLAACSLYGISDLEVHTNKNELVFNDGSALHWHELFSKSDYRENIKLKYSLKEHIFLKHEEKTLVALPYDGFKVSYFMDWNHPALGKLFASWNKNDDIKKILRARTFGTKEENDYFGVSEKILTLMNDKFNIKLHEQLEPVYHKILDIIGDLYLSGINPLEVNMHIFGYKSGHALNVEMAKKLKKSLQFLSKPV